MTEGLHTHAPFSRHVPHKEAELITTPGFIGGALIPGRPERIETICTTCGEVLNSVEVKR